MCSNRDTDRRPPDKHTTWGNLDRLRKDGRQSNDGRPSWFTRLTQLVPRLTGA